MGNLTDSEQETARAYDEIAKEWTDHANNLDIWTKELAVFRKLLPSGRVLEVGAGSGRDAKDLIALGYDYVGTDISEGLLKEARKLNPGATFEQVSLYDLNYSEPFDGFWCSAVLLHVPRDRINEALAAIRRNMRDGAIGFIAIKEGEGEKTLQEDWGKQTPGRHFIYWQNEDFKLVLKQSGYDVLKEEIRPVSKRTSWLIYFVRVKK